MVRWPEGMKLVFKVEPILLSKTMGNITITFRGSFPDELKHGTPLFSAQQHGHVRAVREAIAYLKHTALPEAIELDACLLAEGHEPSAGFQERDLKWLKMAGKSPGEQIPGVEGLMRQLAMTLDSAFPPQWVFLLMAMSVGEAGAMTYVSNGERENMLDCVDELLTKLRGGDEGTLDEPV